MLQQPRGTLTVLHGRDRRPHHLPAPLTTFVGRERELARVCERLRAPDVRLLTLLGPGGAGKTRLAVEAAAELLDACADGVFFVALEHVREPELVPGTILQALGLKEGGQQPPLSSLQSHLRDRALLLVLDNFEQVIGAAPLVGRLLAAAPGLKALVTSRTVLGVYGEHTLDVPPLALPSLEQPLDPAALTQCAAVRLFVERARAVVADFALTGESAPAVAEICHRLDGLPLAIELAAARVRLLPPPALLARLSSRLGLLVGGARTLPERQQTLRSTIDWSYDLLDEGEQARFARLAVFEGGFDLAAAEAVVHGPDDPAPDLLDALQSLLDKSLVRQAPGAAACEGGCTLEAIAAVCAEPPGDTAAALDLAGTLVASSLLHQHVADDEPRFVMLDTVREYAGELLAASGEAEQIRARHCAYFTALAEAAEHGLLQHEQQRWFERIAAERQNLRAAVAWSAAQGDRLAGARIGAALWRFWWVRGGVAEALAWLRDGLAELAAREAAGDRRHADLGGGDEPRPRGARPVGPLRRGGLPARRLARGAAAGGRGDHGRGRGRDRARAPGPVQRRGHPQARPPPLEGAPAARRAAPGPRGDPRRAVGAAGRPRAAGGCGGGRGRDRDRGRAARCGRHTAHSAGKRELARLARPPAVAARVQPRQVCASLLNGQLLVVAGGSAAG
jgi:predicted ATPase